jgi:hypothetical protein
MSSIQTKFNYTCNLLSELPWSSGDEGTNKNLHSHKFLPEVTSYVALIYNITNLVRPISMKISPEK